MERATVWIDTVKRGPMVREVGASARWCPKTLSGFRRLDGQVTRSWLHSGDDVKPDTVLLVLSNPDMELAANDFEWQVKQAEANSPT